MISPSRQREKFKKIPHFYNFHIIMFVFYTFLSNLFTKFDIAKHWQKIMFPSIF